MPAVEQDIPQQGDGKAALKLVLLPISLILQAQITNGFIYRGLVTFLPLYLGERIQLNFLNLDTVLIAGSFTTVVLVFGIFGQFFGGFLSERMSRINIALVIAVVSVPMLIAIGSTAGILLLVSAGINTMTEVNNVRPLIDEEQLGAVEWIRENAEDNAYVLATSNDAPWVLGWSGRRVIAPGLFEWDVHSKDEWIDFFSTESPEAAREFLDVYDAPIYIYYSKNRDNNLGLEKFRGNNFQIVYDNSAVVYKYPGGG